jgi:aminomethyltransferase
MRQSPLKQLLSASGASFSERYGTEIVANIYGREKEYNFVRKSAGLTDFSFMQKFRLPEENGLDFLDRILAGNVAKVRFGRVLHTFLADPEGLLVADCYVANYDEELIVLCESIADDSIVRSIFTECSDCVVEDRTDSRVVLGVDGCKAFSVVKELFGADILGLPYLSIENYTFQNEKVNLLRAGKTSEFGYLLIAPVSIAEPLYKALEASILKIDGGLCGLEVHNDLRLEGRFFNIFEEGLRVKDPLPLGLQWMIDFEKENFLGSEKIMERRRLGLQKKIIGVRAEPSLSLAIGDHIYDGERVVAEVKASCRSWSLDADLGLALFDVDVAYSGLTFNIGSPDGPEVKTISMPPIMPKSLTVKLDEI